MLERILRLGRRRTLNALEKKRTAGDNGAGTERKTAHESDRDQAPEERKTSRQTLKTGDTGAQDKLVKERTLREKPLRKSPLREKPAKERIRKEMPLMEETERASSGKEKSVRETLEKEKTRRKKSAKKQTSTSKSKRSKTGQFADARSGSSRSGERGEERHFRIVRESEAMPEGLDGLEGQSVEDLERRKAMLVALISDPAYVPMKLKEMAILLEIPKEKRRELNQVLNLLVEEGKISISQKGKYGKPDLFAIKGTFCGHPKGFGFVTVEERDKDVFIPGNRTNGALHGDTVLITVDEEGRDQKAEGTVVRILEHANKTLVGTYEKSQSYGFVVPDSQKISRDIFIPQGCDMGAVSGHKVVVKVKDFGEEKGKKPEGVIIEILGHINDPGTDILSIVKAYNLPEEFPKAVMEELEQIPDSVTEDERRGRKDLRALKTVTIDGEEAKDLDDAITLERLSDGYRLGVHIADVTHYVREKSALDTEALKRGTSVYLTDRVIPMLPHKLSNGICSLNQGEDRLALSCLMDIDEKGNVIGHELAETVITVDRRMTYTAVNAIVTEHDAAMSEEYRDFVDLFETMKELADIVRERRHARGAIDFDFPESKIILDENGLPIDIKPSERNSATKIIEDFMLLANETVAEDYFWQEVPFLYRTHEKPDEEKMKRLGTFINNFGYILRMPGGEVHPKEVQKLLDKVGGSPEEALISRLTLRSMKQAKYTTLNTGHFGLAARYYTHFTSPIRRYPDLQIHRIIKEILHGTFSDKRKAHYEKILPEVSVKTSALERRAEEAERETEKLKKVQYMEQYIGQEFDGVISGVTNWGFYVELPNSVEGLVHMTELKDDYYLLDEEHYELIGEMTRRTYKLGQAVRVQVTGCDRFAKTIDFIPVRG